MITDDSLDNLWKRVGFLEGLVGCASLLPTRNDTLGVACLDFESLKLKFIEITQSFCLVSV
jgi:hypothetical protein